MEWLNNPWLVGIGGSILSGILVTVVSRTLLTRRDRREYVQKLLSANREVIYAIRSGISEGHIPDRRIVESLLNATARKYSVERSDLYDPIQVGEELTKEIMDSSFISASTKQQYCDQLESLAPQPPQPSGEVAVAAKQPPTSKSNLEAYRSRMVTMMSAMLGIMTTTMTIVLVFSDRFGNNTREPISESFKFLLPMIAAITSTAVVAMMTLLRNELRRAARKKDQSGPKPKDIDVSSTGGDAT